MSAVTASLCSTLLFVGFVVFVSADQKNITAESGQNVTLTCRAPNNKISAAEWSRADLGDKYVLLYRNGQLDPDHQHPSFRNRVDLQDRQMKDRDLSLILKNVTINDTGTYECRVKIGNNRRKRANLSGEPISIITLSVVNPPGQTGRDGEPGYSRRHFGMIAASGFVIVVFVFVAVVLLINKRYKQQSGESHCPPAEPQIQMSENFKQLNSESPADEHRDKNDLKTDRQRSPTLHKE